MVPGGAAKPCCQIPENLSEPEVVNPERPELKVRVCKCGARHLFLPADALELNLTGSDL